MQTTHPFRPVCRIGLLAVTGLLLWPLLSAMPIAVPTLGTAFAQERPMTPTLLRRLAEAVDGHRTGNPVWVVAEWQFPNRVLGAWGMREAAVGDSSRLASETRESDLGLFGPFRAPVDTLMDLRGFELPPPGARPLPPEIRPRPPGCVHDGHTSAMGICPPDWVLHSAISSITMTYVLASGDTLTSPVPLWADALFFSVPALDKFVLPYYGGIVGMREAMRMRNQMLRNVIP
jgi:hypothetical protein